MYEMFASYNDILRLVCANHKIPNKTLLKKAYDYALESHKNQSRISGEPYHLHPVRVARYVAEWGFESDVVIAALLHDVLEDCEISKEDIEKTFNSEVSDMVDTVTNLNQDLKDMEGLTQEEIQALSDAKLQKYMSDRALYIKLADRLDNLNTIDCLPKERQIKKALHTREIIIPMAVKMGAVKIIDDLAELCFKIEHESQYNAISSYFQEYWKANARTCNRTIRIIEDAFKNGASFLKKTDFPPDLKPYSKFISGFAYRPRSKVSVFRQITHEAKNMKRDFNRLLNKRYIGIYDLTVIFDDIIDSAQEGLNPFDIFFKYYHSFFMQFGICIRDFVQTTQKDTTLFLLSDEMDNLYRLFICTNQSYLRYKIGNIIDSDKHFSEFFDDVNDIDPRDTYKPKIKVFTRNGDPRSIDAGATVLDFAFLLHTDIGLHFDYALINHQRAHVGMHYVLNEGDEIEIFPSERNLAKIQWFRHVKTTGAVKKLVDYFVALEQAYSPASLNETTMPTPSP